jgi:hypothetical protein
MARGKSRVEILKTSMLEFLKYLWAFLIECIVCYMCTHNNSPLAEQLQLMHVMEIEQESCHIEPFFVISIIDESIYF